MTSPASSSDTAGAPDQAASSASASAIRAGRSAGVAGRSTAGVVELLDECSDPLCDVVAGGADLVDRAAFGILELPVDVALAGDVRAFVAAAHGDDDIGLLGELAGELARRAAGEVDAELVHDLHDLGVDSIGWRGARPRAPGGDRAPRARTGRRTSATVRRCAGRRTGRWPCPRTGLGAQLELHSRTCPPRRGSPASRRDPSPRTPRRRCACPRRSRRAGARPPFPGPGRTGSPARWSGRRAAALRTPRCRRGVLRASRRTSVNLTTRTYTTRSSRRALPTVSTPARRLQGTARGRVLGGIPADLGIVGVGAILGGVTAGGINEQFLAALRGAGVFAIVESALDDVADRLESE